MVRRRWVPNRRMTPRILHPLLVRSPPNLSFNFLSNVDYVIPPTAPAPRSEDDSEAPGSSSLYDVDSTLSNVCGTAYKSPVGKHRGASPGWRSFKSHWYLDPAQTYTRRCASNARPTMGRPSRLGPVAGHGRTRDAEDEYVSGSSGRAQVRQHLSTLTISLLSLNVWTLASRYLRVASRLVKTTLPSSLARMLPSVVSSDARW